MTKGKIFAIIVGFLCIIAVGTIFGMNIYNSYIDLVQKNEALEQENQELKEINIKTNDSFQKNEQGLMILND